jgi:hypothetical protein
VSHKAPYAECHYAECRYTESRYAKCHGAVNFATAVSYSRKMFKTLAGSSQSYGSVLNRPDSNKSFVLDYQNKIAYCLIAKVSNDHRFKLEFTTVHKKLECLFLASLSNLV